VTIYVANEGLERLSSQDLHRDSMRGRGASQMVRVCAEIAKERWLPGSVPSGPKDKQGKPR
jgi:hypothetical protein